jgi:hypothetical protein
MGPILPTAPMLVWDGSAGFKTDGLDPHKGTQNRTVFRFKVKYYAHDSDRPTGICVVLKRSGRTYRSFPLGLQRGTDAATGLTYGTSTKLPAGSYSYAFQAKDKHGAATGAPTKALSGPTVSGARASVVSALSAAATRTGGAQISFSLSEAATVTAEVLNLAGRRVATLARGRELEAGAQTLAWSGRSDEGPAAPNGLYLLRLEARSADGSVSRHLAGVPMNR